MLKKQCILFGAGFYGKGAYFKLKEQFDILYYVDNNEKIQNKKVNNILVISLKKMEEIFDKEKMDIIICSQSYQEIADQLVRAGILDYFVMMEGFLYHFSENDVMVAVDILNPPYYRKRNGENSILFVQNIACIRTHKTAALIKKNGYKVFLLYTIAPPEYNNQSFKDIYESIYTVYSPDGLIDFVNNSEFDIIHSSNEPDILTNYLHLTNKKIVFDTHDTITLRGKVTREALALEYIANKNSAGTIHTSEGARNQAIHKYGLQKETTFVLENFISEQITIAKRYEKISKSDGQIHCVYEGGIVGNDTGHHRFFEDIWKKITDCGVHIHFYSQSDYEYCIALDQKSDYLHFEGNLGSKELAVEMTKYDCGLAIFNITPFNKVFLSIGTANKIYEYLNSGLPIIVGNIDSYIRFIEKYNVGILLDLEGDIKAQLIHAASIKIEDDILIKNKITLDSYGKDLKDFYQKIINGEI